MKSAALIWRALLLATTAGAAVNILTLPPPETINPGSIPHAAGAAQPETTPAPSGAVAETYPAIAQYPLFTESRRPWAAPPPPPPAPTPPPAPSPLTSYMAAGVIISGDVRSALLRRVNDTSTILLTEGEELEGWTLKDITRDRLLFVAGTAVYEMISPGAPDTAR